MGWIQKLFGGGGGKQPAGNPRDAFREEIAGRLRAQGFSNVVALTDAFGVACEMPDGEMRHVYLDNLFAETREVPPERREELIARVLGIGRTPAERPLRWEEASPRLRVTLRAPFGIPPGKREKLQSIAGASLTPSEDLMPVRWRTATEVPDAVVAALEAAGVRAGEL